MPAIHKIATLASKGQTTSPKSIRRLPSLDTDSEIVFDVRVDEVVGSRVNAIHENPTISGLLDLLEADLRSERSLVALPDDLTQAMFANAGYEVDPDDEFDGEVAL